MTLSTVLWEPSQAVVPPRMHLRASRGIHRSCLSLLSCGFLDPLCPPGRRLSPRTGGTRVPENPCRPCLRCGQAPRLALMPGCPTYDSQVRAESLNRSINWRFSHTHWVTPAFHLLWISPVSWELKVLLLEKCFWNVIYPVAHSTSDKNVKVLPGIVKMCFQMLDWNRGLSCTVWGPRFENI